MSDPTQFPGFETRSVHAGQRFDPTTGAVIPPVHFSIFISQRGKTHQLEPGMPVICVPMPGMLAPGNVTLLRSIIIALDIFELLS